MLTRPVHRPPKRGVMAEQVGEFLGFAQGSSNGAIGFIVRSMIALDGASALGRDRAQLSIDRQWHQSHVKYKIESVYSRSAQGPTGMAIVTPLTDRSRADGARDRTVPVNFAAAIAAEGSGRVGDDPSAHGTTPVVAGCGVNVGTRVLAALSVRRAGKTPAADSGATRGRLSSLRLRLGS